MMMMLLVNLWFPLLLANDTVVHIVDFAAVIMEFQVAVVANLI